MTGHFDLTQTVHGSAETGPAWSTNFNPLTVGPIEYQRVNYDVTVTTVYANEGCWVDLDTTTTDGQEGFYSGTLTASRMRTWYAPNGQPYGKHVR